MAEKDRYKDERMRWGIVYGISVGLDVHYDIST
jgi:hypothetical protein